MKKASDYLKEAAKVIDDRAAFRDKPDGEYSMARAVQAYVALHGPKIETELDGWLFMCVLKLARATAGKTHEDDWTDLSGYAALAAECITKGPETKKEAAKPAVPPQSWGIDAAWDKKEPEWIKWEGGENPVRGKKVEVKLRGEVPGTSAWTTSANSLYWTHEKDCNEGDIVAYRVVD